MFQKAERTKLKLRLGIEGPSGSGKTFSALRIATGLAGEGGRICVIDSENNSASLYSEKFDFDVGVLDAPYTPERYIEYIKGAEKVGYDCIIIDSISHEWMGPGGVLEIHDKMPGNSWTNWAKINPRHDAFVQAILTSNTHIIVTMRSKQAHVQEQNSQGKNVVKKVGMQPQQRDGLDYELTAVLSVDISNQAQGTKDRSGLFPIDKWFIPSEGTGVKLINWLNHGKEQTPIERELKQSDVVKWDGVISKDDIVTIDGRKIKPPQEQLEKLRGHEKYKNMDSKD